MKALTDEEMEGLPPPLRGFIRSFPPADVDVEMLKGPNGLVISVKYAYTPPTQHWTVVSIVGPEPGA